MQDSCAIGSFERANQQVEVIRRFVRTSETDSLPMVDDVRDKIAKSRTDT